MGDTEVQKLRHYLFDDRNMSATPPRSRYDVVVVGGGHNGLTAAAYLARAGRSVLLLERADHLGGATQSVRAFRGQDALLSRYSYLVSLMPRAVRDASDPAASAIWPISQPPNTPP